MALVPRHIIDSVRDATDIVAVVSKYVKLSRGRRDHKGLCPFHQEKTPSFHVVPEKGIYHCFGCQAGGDIFRFLMAIEGLSFIEAVKELAGPAGIIIEEEELTPEQRDNLKKRATLYEVMEEAAQLFETTLWTRPEGERGRAYIDERGLDRDMARKARVSFAPDEWSLLLDTMHRRGYTAQQLTDVGLVKPRSKSDGYYDTFRNRLLFPIRDERSRVIAFGGRLLDGEGPKYLNTPETRLYNKSNVLYGLDMARQAIQRKDRTILVEGYFDVLALHQAGFEEAVAISGTALSEHQCEKLRRSSRNVIMLLDADEAGSRAAMRSLPTIVTAGLSASRLQLPDAKDPDELIREKGADAMTEALKHTVPLIEWVVDYQLQKVDDPVAREHIINDLVPVLAGLPGNLLSRVARATNVPERILLERVQQARREGPSSRARKETPAAPPTPAGWRPNREMVHLLWLLVHRRDKVADVVQHTDPRLLDEHLELRGIVARLIAGEPVANTIIEAQDPGVSRTLSAVVARESLYTESEARLGVCQILEKLGRPRREARLAQLTIQIKDAQRASDRPRIEAALRDQAELRKRIRALDLASRKNDVENYTQLLDAELQTNRDRIGDEA